jgi:hypothetical protein
MSRISTPSQQLRDIIREVCAWVVGDAVRLLLNGVVPIKQDLPALTQRFDFVWYVLCFIIWHSLGDDLLAGPTHDLGTVRSFRRRERLEGGCCHFSLSP